MSIMKCRDRTKTFRKLVKEYNTMGYDNQHYHFKDSKSPDGSASYLKFAFMINTKVHDTTLRLQELEKMSKKITLFDLSNDKLQTMSIQIRDSINEVEADIGDLGKSTTAARCNEQTRKAVKVAMDILNSKLFKLTHQFKSALKERSKIIKEQEERRSRLPFGESSKKKRTNKVNIFGGRSKGENNKLLNASQNDSGFFDPESGQMLEQDNDTEIQARTQSIENIEKTLGELTTIFQRLSHMVLEQQEMIERRSTH